MSYRDPQENWELRKLQSAAIVGTRDHVRLGEAVTAARAAVAAQPADTSGGSWISLGPSNVPGRIGALALGSQNRQRLYAGSAAGGVFQSLDGGAHWEPLWSEQDSLAIGGLAGAPSDDAVVYAATGEWEGGVSSTRYHHFPGVGVYRTTDGGEHWTPSPITSKWTSAVAVDPTDPERVFVAGEQALHRSRNGGQSWDIGGGQTHGVRDGTATDVVIDPDDVSRIYLGVHAGGVFRSTDGGNRWTQLRLPGVTLAEILSPKIALGRRGASGTQFVAVLSHGHVFTSTDGGDRFVERTRLEDIPSYVAWCTAIAVHPADEDVILAGHILLWRSQDGGRSWDPVGGRPHPPVHSDQQAIVFDPARPDRVFVATDGGVFESTDAGQRWERRNDGLVTTQCYTVSLSRTAPLRIGITTQDNGAYQGDGSPTVVAIDDREGGWIEYDPTDASTLYLDVRTQQDRPAPLRKSTTGGATWTELGIDSDAPIREALSIARDDPRRLLLVDSTGRLRRSTTGGMPASSWKTVLEPGVPIVAVEFSPSDTRHAYAASDAGRIWHSIDGGARWRELPVSGLPRQPVNDLEVDPRDPLRLFVAFGANDVTFGGDVPAVWRADVTAAETATWTNVSGVSPDSLPPRLAITGLAIDPRDSDILYASHLSGVHRSTDGGRSWERFDAGLPRCFVADLDVHVPSLTLYAATMGRGLYQRPIG